MAVTKRLRFEILRRDDHTCQYCGAKAPDVKLTVDHVVPTALGGDDKPTNLLAACADCNGGKTSIAPDSPLVQSVAGEAAAYLLGMQDKMTRLRADMEALEEYVGGDGGFDERWDHWRVDGKAVPKPADYQTSLFRWMRMGVPMTVFDLAIGKAMAAEHVKASAKFTYMAGVVWNIVNEREVDYTVTAETAAVCTEGEVSDRVVDAYEQGWKVGYEVGGGVLSDLEARL